MFRHASRNRREVRRYVFCFLERRGYATTALAGPGAVAQPSWRLDRRLQAARYHRVEIV